MFLRGQNLVNLTILNHLQRVVNAVTVIFILNLSGNKCSTLFSVILDILKMVYPRIMFENYSKAFCHKHSEHQKAQHRRVSHSTFVNPATYICSNCPKELLKVIFVNCVQLNLKMKLV